MAGFKRKANECTYVFLLNMAFNKVKYLANFVFFLNLVTLHSSQFAATRGQKSPLLSNSAHSRRSQLRMVPVQNGNPGKSMYFL